MSASPNHLSDSHNGRSRRRTRWPHLLAVLALGAAAACTSGGDETSDTTAATEATGGTTGTEAAAPVNDAPTTTSTNTSSFSSTGTERDGLYWLEDGSAVARWQLADLPSEPVDLAVQLRTVVPADVIAADGTGLVSLEYGQGDTTLGTQEVTLPAVPLGDDADLAMLSGSTVIAATTLPAQLSELWVELATAPTGVSSLAVAPDSLIVEVAPAGLDSDRLASVPTSASAPEITRLDGEFTTNGDLISGWYWLRDEALTQFAHWDFPVVPNIADGVTAQLHVLATDSYDGGPGIDARFYLSYGFLGSDGEPLDATGSGTDATETTIPQRKFAPPPPDIDFAQETMLLTVPNISPPDDSVGYTAQDTLVISAEEIPDGAVGMWFGAAREDPDRLGEPTSEHVAFNAASIGLLIGMGDSGTGTDGTDGTDGALLGCEFATDGDPISGWYWIRDAAFAQYARWTCAAVPNLAEGVTVELDMLATDGVSGGPDVDARFYLTYGFLDAEGAPLDPMAGETTLLTVPNVSPPDDPVGYTARDTLPISADQVPDGAASMWFEASRSDPGRLGEPTTEHVAFNAASITLLAGTTTDGGTTDDGTTDDEDGDVNTDSDVLDDPDGLADADSKTDADDVGDLPPGTYHGTLDGETEDWFAFQLDATQLVDFSITVAAESYVSAELYDPRGTSRAPQPSEIGAPAFSHAAGRSSGGRWYIHLYRLQGTGEYTFTFTVRDANDGLLHLDAGDSIDTATSVGSGDLLGELRSDDGSDYYTFVVPAGRALSATVETMTDNSFEIELRGANRTLVADDIAYSGDAAVLLLEADDADRTFTISVEIYNGVGGPYRLHLDASGLGECSGTPVAAVDFHSGGDPTGILGGAQTGWSWMGPDPGPARGQSSTWVFESLPDDAAVKVLFDVQLDRTIDPTSDDAWTEAWPPSAAAVYLTYGIVTDGGEVTIGEPQFVTLSIESRSGSPTGFGAIGEAYIPHSELADADDAWWLRVDLIDPSALRPARAPAAIGVSLASVAVCAGGTVTALDGFSGAVDPPALTVSYDAATKTMTSTASMFVEPSTDLDGDGLHQGFESQALAQANPIIALDEEELWQHWLDDAPTVNFAQATLWPSAANPQYIVLGYLTTWAFDAGGGPQGLGTIGTLEEHRGDSERIWEAWKIVDDQTIRLEWVNTSAHASYTEHSGIWHVSDRQCTKAYVASISGPNPGWGFFEVMCGDLEFSDDGRVVIHSSENKHAMYPSKQTCESVSVGALAGTGDRLYGEDCDWVEEPRMTDVVNYALWLLGWHNSDFDSDPRYKDFGRWLFDIYNVGEPGYRLIDDLDDPSSWIGLTTTQVTSLTGLYPTEAVWTGHDDFSRFCGGLEPGDVLVLPAALDKVMPNDPTNCSTKLGGKFTEWQPMFLDAMASRYRVTLQTGTESGAGTDDAVFVQLHDDADTLLATKRYDGEFENGMTDVVYLPPYGAGGDFATVSVRRSGLEDSTFANWYLHAVTVEDLVTGQTSTYPVDQWILPGAGVTLS